MKRREGSGCSGSGGGAEHDGAFRDGGGGGSARLASFAAVVGDCRSGQHRQRRRRRQQRRLGEGAGGGLGGESPSRAKERAASKSLMREAGASGECVRACVCVRDVYVCPCVEVDTLENGYRMDLQRLSKTFSFLSHVLLHSYVPNFPCCASLNIFIVEALDSCIRCLRRQFFRNLRGR